VDTVGEAMQDEAIRHYVQQTIDEEIIPALDLPAGSYVNLLTLSPGAF
jgi:tagaturonate reductase